MFPEFIKGDFSFSKPKADRAQGHVEVGCYFLRGVVLLIHEYVSILEAI